MIAIVDYGMGNVLSVRHAFEHLNQTVIVTDKPEELRKASHIILPGVGSFQAAMEEIHARNLYDLLIELAQTKPFLGICLGMQLLFTEGTEGKHTEGLDLIPGTIRKIKTDYILPHVGWNQLMISNQHKAFKQYEQAFVYFVHTYQAETDDKYIVAKSTYGEDITAIVRKDNIFGIQFHPEKSAKIGSSIIQTFLNEVTK
ncbi:imidazole glycerol phosphate synthase subunit HisH [Halolactibacillus alkaliphilus]|uniref:Imidazole glycerol phosphate synthase subunit HisH n=1 Tax=Halolactibacillus alkaliphilus TaxID=442899 RepID=A0A511WZY4_9BACI|nr:imidazole glycerol phosphate synthase subunit HisH [Halolactibacillus alkaliphilus]GEN56249.1 imidazole glycerol phosphate synthase subunit HisH [Halolactibacillus alkaliphilus]GGN66399.1 imidazole glycerol phosphate synthase subunit HisH [Halolactibacillus alkaliphilus]SFO67543.1 glutamine amidotransferase [Halolactibacillus alkaliphilus]